RKPEKVPFPGRKQKGENNAQSTDRYRAHCLLLKKVRSSPNRDLGERRGTSWASRQTLGIAMKKSPPPLRNRCGSARELAIAGLGFIAAEPDRLGRFLALSGIGPESVREAAREPGFLAGVLDHVAGDEGLLVAFAHDRGIAPQDLMAARAALAGPGW